MIENLPFSEKKDLRPFFSELRKSLSVQEKISIENQIFDRFIKLKQYAECNQILLYSAVGSELSTEKVFKYASGDGRRCCFPVCINDCELVFRYVTPNDTMKTGMYGIDEPSDSSQVFIPSRSDICIVPAFSFDLEGFRLGYGKGYYDRFLSGFTGVSVGFCPHSLLSEKLPRNSHDVSVNIIVTEKGVIEI